MLINVQGDKKNLNLGCLHPVAFSLYIFPPEDGRTTEIYFLISQIICNLYKYIKQMSVRVE
jgi:hypothetical protein